MDYWAMEMNNLISKPRHKPGGSPREPHTRYWWSHRSSDNFSSWSLYTVFCVNTWVGLKLAGVALTMAHWSTCSQPIPVVASIKETKAIQFLFLRPLDLLASSMWESKQKMTKCFWHPRPATVRTRFWEKCILEVLTSTMWGEEKLKASYDNIYSVVIYWATSIGQEQTMSLGLLYFIHMQK